MCQLANSLTHILTYLHGLLLALKLSHLVNDRAPPGLGFPACQVGKLVS